MAEYFTLSDNGTPEQHTGDVSDAPVDYKKMMLDYGWIPPVAYGAYKLAEPLIEKGRDYLKSRKLGKQEKGPMAFGDEGIIDVSSRDVTEKEPAVTKAPVEKQNPLDAYSQEKHGYPLSTLEDASGGPLTKQSEIDLISNQLKKGQGITVNTLPGTVSNQPAGFPNGISPINQLTTQPPAPQLIQPKTLPVNPVTTQIADVQARNQAAEFRAKQLTPVVPPPPPPATPVDLVAAAQSGQDMSQPIKEDVAHMLQEADKTPSLAHANPSSAIKVEGLVRDAQGNFQYPPGMSPAAIEGHKAFNQQYPEHARALEAEGKFGIVGGGAADNSLRNSYGSKLRKQILNEVNQGQLGGINTNYLENINPAIKALSTESGLGKTLAELKANNPKVGIHGPLGTPATIGKLGELVSKPGAVSGLVNKGSIPFLLMAMADAAKAAQQGKYAEAAAQGLDIGTDYIPGVSQFKQGMSPNVANSPIVPPQQISNAALLGSPYAQTEWAKAQRQRNKAGAGQGQRGVPPPNQR